jgi:YHS domain-containing protein
VLRVVAPLILGGLLFLVLRAVVAAFVAGFRGAPESGGRRAVTRDELVRDPVCETYIPRGKAVARQTPAGPRYFCSGACADRFQARAAGDRG